MSNSTIAMVVGSVAFVYGIFLLFRMFSSRNWASVEGRITASQKSFASTDAGEMEDANITYMYTVGDKIYTSSVIKSGGDVLSHRSKESRTDVDRLLAKYPIGNVVTVYYHPKMPQLACLEKAGGEALLICLIFGPLAIIVGYFFL